jgi:hypothetical protein
LILILLCVLTCYSPAENLGAEQPERQILALQRELALAKASPSQYYLTINIPDKTVLLKAGGRELMSSSIVQTNGIPDEAISFVYRETCPPHSPLAGQRGTRLAGRRLPLNFVGRLIEGPTKYDRLVFEPELVIGSDRSPVPDGVPHILVSGDDIKSLSSAVDSATIAILIDSTAR